MGPTNNNQGREGVEGVVLYQEDWDEATEKKNKARGWKVSFLPITERNVSVEVLKTMNEALFPVPYTDTYYTSVYQTAQPEFSFQCLLSDIPVGTCCCRLECKNEEAEQAILSKSVDINELPEGTVVHILTFGVLPAYRRLGLGLRMLKRIIGYAESNPKIDALELHVQTNNESALKFYKANGFTETAKDEDYYPKLTPSSAFILRRDTPSPA